MPENDRQRAGSLGGEEALIAEFFAPLSEGFPGAYGLKDDCAAIAVPSGHELIVTTDAVIAGVHVLPGDEPGGIAWKALAVNVSDLVAKGAVPLGYVMNLALRDLDRSWLAAFSGGLRNAQTAFGCHLIGGDTDRTPGPLSVSITAFGTVPSGGMVQRTTARAGDIAFVSGTIGDAALGLALRHDPQLADRAGLDAEACAYLENRLSRPRPPLALGPALRACASSAMDVSDGLMKDFDRLCRASGVGGRLQATLIPLSSPARKAISTEETDLADLMSGGEDYEVLATVSPAKVAQFEDLARAAGIPVTRIGVVTTGPAGAVAIDPAGEIMSFGKLGWDHFLAR